MDINEQLINMKKQILSTESQLCILKQQFIVFENDLLRRKEPECNQRKAIRKIG